MIYLISGSCADTIRQSYNLAARPAPTPIGCLQIANEVNARSHPSFDGTRLGSVSPATHGGTYFYYATQADSDSTGVNDQWYQVAPLGYSRFAAPNQAKNGHALWIRASFGTEVYLSNIQSTCPGNATMITDIGSPVGSDNKPVPDIWTDFFGGFTTDEEILAYILACESGYEIQAARDIAYVIRSRMMSDSFRNTWQNIDNTWQGIIRHQYAWQCWGDAAAVAAYNDATGARLDTINLIKQEIVPSVAKLPSGGLGTLAFAPSNPKIEYALYTLGDALYGVPPKTENDEITAYRSDPINGKLLPQQIVQRIATNFSGAWVPNSCFSETILQRIYIDHSRLTDSDLVTVFFTEPTNCVFQA